MKALKAALFDFDDTLMATRGARVSILLKVITELGYRATSEDVVRHWGKPFVQLIESLAPGIDFQSFYSRYAEAVRKSPPHLLPGVSELLAKLRSHKVIILVVSSGSRDLVLQDIEAGHLLQHISQIWGYEDTPTHKPNPQALAPILQNLIRQGIGADQIIYFGDSLSDYRVARGNSIQFCAVLSGSDMRQDFQLAGMQDDMIVNSLQELSEETSWLNKRLEAES